MSELALTSRLSGVKQALANVESIPDATKVGDLAHSIREALKRVGAEKQLVDEAARVFVQAKIIVGTMLGNHPGKAHGQTAKGKHASHGCDALDRMEINRCRAVAWKIEEGILDRVFNCVTKSNEHFAFRHALTLSRLKAELQHAATEIFETGKASTLADAVREAKKREIVHGEDMVLDGQFRTIVIDPPWPMQKISREAAPNQESFDYAEQSIEDIAKLEMPAHDNCHLYCWTTQRFLPETFEIIEGWGFKYLVTMVWHKAGGFQPVGLPQYNCEFCILGRRGSLGFLDAKDFMCCFHGKRREHSRKPDEFYDLIRRVSPMPRADIFSRERREGFMGFGWEAGKFANIQ